MKIFIIGIGRIGLNLAETYSLEAKHDIYLFDTDKEILDNISDRLDVFCIHDSGVNINALAANGIENVDLFLAVTNDEITNFFACSLAKKFNSKVKTICLGTLNSNNIKKYLSSKSLGVDHLIVPEVECVNLISQLIKKPYLKECITLASGDLKIDAINIKLYPGSFFIGKTIREITKLDGMQKLEIVFIWRKECLLLSEDKIRLNNYDEIYIVGEEQKLEALLKYFVFDKQPLKKIVFIGYDDISLQLIRQLQKNSHYQIELIDPEKHRPQDFFEKENLPIPIVSADFNQEIAEQTDLDDETAVISRLSDNGDSVLAALLAKRNGAKQSFVIIKDFDYREIVSSMDSIDSCFNPYIASLNAIFSLSDIVDFGMKEFLFQRISAEIYEAKLPKLSPLLNKDISEISLPQGVKLGLLIRGDKVFTIRDEVSLTEGDKVFLFTFPKSKKKIQKFLNEKSYFKL